MDEILDVFVEVKIYIIPGHYAQISMLYDLFSLFLNN